MPNEMERRRWNNEQMATAWPKRERFTDPVTPYVMRALEPRAGERVLDVGCGGGKLAVAIGRAVSPGGRVVGADISQPMAGLAKTRAKDAGATNVTFQVLDMQTGKPTGGPFDAATSQFGVMFFDDPAAAFANIRKQLKPGGRLAFACWQPGRRNPWFYGPVVAPFVPPPPPPEPGKAPTGPFALGDPRRTRSILDGAGFANVSRSAHRIVVRAPADSLVDSMQLENMGIPQSKWPEAMAAIEVHMKQFLLADGTCRFPLAFQLFTARNLG